MNTDDYMQVVLDSVFTLSPAGHNPECFRLYEAMEAGSIPILTNDDMRGVCDLGRDLRLLNNGRIT
jgi:hypothetical protein